MSTSDYVKHDTELLASNIGLVSFTNGLDQHRLLMGPDKPSVRLSIARWAPVPKCLYIFFLFFNITIVIGLAEPSLDSDLSI